MSKILNRVTNQIEQSRQAYMQGSNIFLAVYSEALTLRFTGYQLANLISGIEASGWNFAAWHWKDIQDTTVIYILFRRQSDQASQQYFPNPQPSYGIQQGMPPRGQW